MNFVSMTSKLISVLVFALGLTSFRCEDWCSLIKPNGRYEGLGMYRYFNLDRNIPDAFVMYNRAGSEWKFTFDPSYDPFTLIMIENSTKRSDNENTLLRYGFYLSARKKESDTIGMGGNVFDCSVKHSDNGTGFIGEAVFDHDPKRIHLDTTTKFYDKSVIFKLKHRQYNQILLGADWYVYNKLNKSQYFFYNPLEEGSGRFRNCSTSSCAKMSYAKDMDDSLFAQIDDVVHFDDELGNGQTGHLLLFKMDGKPKYCFLPLIDAQNNKYSLSDCIEGMQTLFDECFVDVIEPISEQISEQITESQQTVSENSETSKEPAITEEASNSNTQLLFPFLSVHLLTFLSHCLID